MAGRPCLVPTGAVRCNGDGAEVRAFVDECAGGGSVVWLTAAGLEVPQATAQADYLPCTPACEDCPEPTAAAVQQVGVNWTLHDDNADNYPQRASAVLEDGQTVEATFFSLPYTTSFPPTFGSTRSGGANPFHNVDRCGGRHTLGIARGGPNSIHGVRFTFSSGVTPYPLAITLVDFDGSAERWRSNFGDPTIMPANAELQPPNGNAAANPASWIASTVDSPVAQQFVWTDCRTQPPPGGVVEFEIHDRNPAVMNVAIALCPYSVTNCAGEEVTPDE